MLGSRKPLKTRIFRATLAQQPGIVCIEHGGVVLVDGL